MKNRTSAAKAAPAQYIYGTAEAVPFVQSVFPLRVKPCPSFSDLFRTGLAAEGTARLSCCGGRRHVFLVRSLEVIDGALIEVPDPGRHFVD